MFFSLQEIIDLVVMIAAVGFIFKDYVRLPSPTKEYEPLDELKMWKNRKRLSDGFKDAVLVTAPAVALHELGHKIAALSFGLEATFHAAYMWLGIGVLLKLLGAPFIFFIPGYVSYSARGVEPFVSALIALAGPLVNLLLFLFAWLAIKQGWFAKKIALLYLTKHINLFLFIFNMLPLFGFDGSHVLESILQSLR